MGGVIISPNIKKTSDRIDINGNIINPRTKEILVPKEVEIQPVPPLPKTSPEAVTAPTAGLPAKDSGLDVLSQIEATKQRLQELEELKKLKIAEKKAELELLEQ